MLVCDSHVTVVRCLEVQAEYVRVWLRTDHVYGLIEDRAAGSTNQIELTAQMANAQPVPLPPLAEQRRIVAKVEELMALLDRLEAARAAREGLRDRLTAASLARLTDAGRGADPDAGAQDDAIGAPAIARTTLATLPTLTTRPDQIKPLRQTILNLAVRGRLVEQDAEDEPASELLKRIASDKKERAVSARDRRAGAIKALDGSERPFDLPASWHWVAFGDITISWAIVSLTNPHG
jgi:type I restriction enzyme S subunit